MESEAHAQPKLELPGMIGFSRAKVSIVTAHVAEVRRVVEGHRRRVHRRVVQQIGELKDKSGAHAAFPPQTNILRNRAVESPESRRANLTIRSATGVVSEN